MKGWAPRTLALAVLLLGGAATPAWAAGAGDLVSACREVLADAGPSRGARLGRDLFAY